MDVQRVNLTFALGDRILFRKGFRLLVENLCPTAGDGAVDLDALLQQVPDDCAGLLVRSYPTPEPLPKLARHGAMIRYAPNQYERYFTDLRGTFEQYLETFSGKTRSTLRRKVRKFAEFAGVEPCWRLFRRPDEIDAFRTEALAVSATTYQHRLLGTGLPDGEGFHKRMIDWAEADAARGYLLYHGERPVAYLYCPIADGVVQYAYVGYDPEYRQWSPGTVLQFYALESLFAEDGLRMFDFDLGEGEHKRLFSTNHVRCADVFCLRATWRNRFWVFLHRMTDGLSAGIGRTLERLRLKAAVKRLLRRA